MEKMAFFTAGRSSRTKLHDVGFLIGPPPPLPLELPLRYTCDGVSAGAHRHNVATLHSLPTVTTNDFRRHITASSLLQRDTIKSAA